MSMETAVKEQTINRRQAYKNQKLQEANEIYYCECGKNYLTFSALYLHARNKHEVKLTTKRNQFNSKVENKEDKVIVTYFIHNNQIEQLQSVIQPQENNPTENYSHSQQPTPQITQVLHQYAQIDTTEFTTAKNCKKMVIEQLINYFQQVQQLKAQNYPLEVDNITLYFNDFILGYLPAAHQQGYISLNALAQAENQMIRLWRWLRECNYTQSQLLHRTYPPYYNN